MPNIADFLDHHAAWLPLIIFLCRICDVSIGTVRMIFVVRGARYMAPILGFFEVGIWIVAVSSVVTRLDRPINIVAYAGGFATGNWVGMWLESKLAIGQQIVRIISRDRGHSIAHALRINGFPVTTLRGRGREGPVTLCFAAVSRRLAPALVRTALSVDSDAFVTVEETRTSGLATYSNVTQPKGGWRAIFQRR
jgi:uncharacterized protein YebE (UPF0316 family)